MRRIWLLIILAAGISSFQAVFAESAVTVEKIGSRTVTFVNQCPFPVWFGIISGSVQNNQHAGSTNCQTNDDCPSGAKCIQTGDTKQCFWINPKPANNNYKLTADGGTNQVTFPIYDNGIDTGWSGAAAGRTLCTAKGCQTADCSNGAGGCPASKGFQPPVTQAEFTFNTQSSDYYDVELVNGFNLPVELAPNVAKPTGKNPYQCGNPGAVTPMTKVGACSWEMQPPSNDYVWVTSSDQTCKTNADCGGKKVCGLSDDPNRTPRMQRTCGKFLGYWSADQVCGNQSDFGQPFDCDKKLPPPQQNLTMTNLYGCTQIGSCYQQDANEHCCGCVDWDKIGISVPPYPYTQQCVNQNIFWVKHVLPTLKWIKKACPTAYTYPYDDMSSTFTCRKPTDKAKINSVNYTITFCPGGKTGQINK